MAYYKLQSPLKLGADYVYPLTSYDQIILADGTRWNGKSLDDSAYLPLTGGTLTAASGATPLTLKSGTGQASSYLKFVNTNDTVLGWIGFQSQDNPVISYGTSTTDYSILHTGNYSSYALPLTGGTINGTVSAAKFEGTYEAGSTTSTTYKHFRVSRLGSDGNYAQGFFYISSSGASAQIGVSKNGTTVGTATLGTNLQYTGKVIAAGATFSQDVIMTGAAAITSANIGSMYYLSRDAALIKHTAHTALSSYSPLYSLKGASGDFAAGLIHYPSGESDLQWIYVLDSDYNAGNNNFTSLMTLTSTGKLTATKVYGAVWNDYAEYRSQNETIEPGYITYCDDDGKLKKTVERLQKYEGVVSDTYGFAIGETDDCKTPLAVSGRALVYCDPEEEHFHSGDCVCAGPDGLAYRMTREEIIEFPDRIVGVVSEIPTYETWGSGNVEVDGRIWIKVK